MLGFFYSYHLCFIWKKLSLTLGWEYVALNFRSTVYTMDAARRHIE